MPQIHTEIFIRRSPADVREIFLDFPSWSTWHTGYVKSIKPTSPTDCATLSNKDLQGSSMLFTPGATIAVDLADFGVITPTVLHNDGHQFKWRGGNKWVGFMGEHGFRWEEGVDEQGNSGTRFVQDEYFSGYLSWLLMGESWLSGLLGLRVKTKSNFEGLNVEFKKKCEVDSKKVV